MAKVTWVLGAIFMATTATPASTPAPAHAAPVASAPKK
jgi:hypothetical protein